MTIEEENVEVEETVEPEQPVEAEKAVEDSSAVRHGAVPHLDRGYSGESTKNSFRKPTFSRTVSRVKQELVDFKDGYRMTPGDWGSTTQLFFDNLSTLLGALFAIQDMANFGVDIDDINDVVFGKIVPGVGMTLVIGNTYYTWMGIRLTKKWGRPYTAQPYGLNTPAAFSFVFNIMYPVYFSLVGSVGPAEAFEVAYAVALGANFITGIISIVLGVFGPLILKVVPPAALLVPIAGIGIAFLGIEQVSNSIAAPLVGYPAIAWVFLGWYAGVRVGWGKYRIPEALQVIIVGVALGWATGLNEAQTVKDAADLVEWIGPDWSADELFSDFDLVKDYLGIIIPIGISATATTLMCLVSAQQAGDPYPVRETMIFDGFGTMIASFFGSPFGTVVYIGHPAHKRSGALVGYSLFNGWVYLILSWFGILALMQSIVNQATIGPIVLFVGLMINEETLNFIPSRHYPAYIVGLFPSLYDWVVNVSGQSPILDNATGGNINLDGTLNNWYGVLAWKRGAILVSMIWVAMIVMIIDRKWKQATIWAGIGSVFALFGIIHMPEAGFDNFNNPVWEQCISADNCWEHGEQWMFFVAYLMLGGFFICVEIAKRFDSSLKGPIDDHTAHAFDDWFKDADTDTRHRWIEEAHVSEEEKEEDYEEEEEEELDLDEDGDPTGRSEDEDVMEAPSKDEYEA